MGKNALASMVEVYGLFYCTEILQIDARLAGLIIFMSLAWDALVAPLVGFWADRQLARRFHLSHLLIFGMPLTIVAFLLFFHLHLLSSGPPVLYACVALIVFRTAYTIVDIPHNSLLVFSARHSADRKRLASLRIFFSALGKVCLTVTAAVTLSPEAADAPQAIGSTSIVMALVFLITLSICVASIQNIPITFSGGGAWRPIASLKALLRSTPELRLAFVLTAINSTTIPIIGVVLIYSSKYHLDSTEIGATALVVQSIVQAVASLAWDRLPFSRASTAKLLIFAYVGLLSVIILVCLLPISVSVLFILAAGSGTMIGGIFMFNWVFFSDVLADARGKTETDTTISAFGLYSIVNKVCHGLAQAISGTIVATMIASGVKDHPKGFIHLPLLTFVGIGVVIIIIFLLYAYVKQRSTSSKGSD